MIRLINVATVLIIMGEANFTSIPISPEMRDRVKSLKRGGESYDELMDRVIDCYEQENNL